MDPDQLALSGISSGSSPFCLQVSRMKKVKTADCVLYLIKFVENMDVPYIYS